MKLVHQYGSNSRVVMDEDDYGKFRLERVTICAAELFVFIFHSFKSETSNPISSIKGREIFILLQNEHLSQ